MYETILVVDDEPEMRSFVAEALQTLGYIVLDTGDPQQALRVVKDQPVHLLLTDVVMPMMKGTELADRVQAVSPSTRVLLMSGYQTSDSAPSARPFLAKPFGVETLAARVREVVASPSAFARPRRSP